MITTRFSTGKYMFGLFIFFAFMFFGGLMETGIFDSASIINRLGTAGFQTLMVGWCIPGAHMILSEIKGW